MVNKVIIDLDFTKASGPDCIPVMVLKNCEPELSYVLDRCLKESCFPDCRKVLSVVPVFKNVGERSTAKKYRPDSLLSVIIKVFKKLVNNKIVDHDQLLDQQQTFSQLYLIELVGLLTGLGLLKL